MNILAATLAEKGVLLSDGGTGTGLFARGLETGDCPELWNTDHPERIADLHKEFIDAGSDIILTNTFGGNRYRLKLHQAENRVAELNKNAAEIARSAAEKSPKKILVAGSIGPTGEILAPVGSLNPKDAVSAFAEQAVALAQGGADFILCETLSSTEELLAALEGAAKSGLPVAATMSFDTNGRTMMGLTPDAAISCARSSAHPPAAFGANCGIGPAQLIGTLLGFDRMRHSDDIMMAKGNCGIPEYEDGHIHYSGTPEIMATYARFARAAGAKIIGGCCGTSGEHLKAMRRELDGPALTTLPSISDIEQELGPVTTPSEASEAKERDKGRRRRRRNA